MGKRDNSRNILEQEPLAFCFVCGLDPECPDEELIFEEREEWRKFRRPASVLVEEDLVEGVFFQKEPVLSMSFYRAIIDSPDDEPLWISGITQSSLTYGSGPPNPVPRDRHKARIGFGGVRSNNRRRYFAKFQAVDMLHPERNDEDQHIGYVVHSNCWLLLDRVIGHQLLDSNLRIFVDAIRRYWKKNKKLWRRKENCPKFHDPFYPVSKRLRRHISDPDKALEEVYDADPDERLDAREIMDEQERILELPNRVDCYKNPVVVPEIRALIEKAIQDGPPENARNFQPKRQQSVVFDTPAEIALMIVNKLYDDIYEDRAEIDDIRNMLAAFQWRLPDSYWQKRCMMDLIFEFEDLKQSENSGHQRVDWQFLCLETHELFLKPRWYDEGGLKNRGRILQILWGLKEVFLKMIK